MAAGATGALCQITSASAVPLCPPLPWLWGFYWESELEKATLKEPAARGGGDLHGFPFARNQKAILRRVSVLEMNGAAGMEELGSLGLVLVARCAASWFLQAWFDFTPVCLPAPSSLHPAELPLCGAWHQCKGWADGHSWHCMCICRLIPLLTHLSQIFACTHCKIEFLPAAPVFIHSCSQGDAAAWCLLGKLQLFQ